jgi:hypothetical protein
MMELEIISMALIFILLYVNSFYIIAGAGDVSYHSIMASTPSSKKHYHGVK